MSEIEFIKRKGGKILLLEGFRYYKQTVYKNRTVKWRCSNWKHQKCTGTITIEDGIIIKKKEHKCKADHVKNEKDKCIARLRDEVKRSDLPVPKLYDDALKSLSQQGLSVAAESFPDLSNVKHLLYSHRNAEAGVSKTKFDSQADVEVPKKFQDFILANYFCEGQRIILFCTKESKKLMGTTKEFFGDATFQSCPKPFSQLYTLLGDFGSSDSETNVKPLVFALMPDKKEHTYYAMFEMIKSQIPEWSPSKLHCDFELASINAILRVFPTLAVIGCYYHWGRCMWKHAKLMGFDKTKQERRIISLCAALPLLPAENIEEGFEYISRQCALDIFCMQKFIDYVRKTWLKPKYINMISVYGERHRTNNVAEGFHAKLNKSVHKNTVNITRLLNVLQGTCTVKEIQRAKKTKRSQKLSRIDDSIRQVLLELITDEITLGHALEKLR